MATPNYAYEKRQRELAKKRKKDEKASRKSQGTSGGDDNGGQPADSTGNPSDLPPAQPTR
jgi:hypothetical protein